MAITIFKTIFGSRLYGTENELSDYDVKSVVLPDPAECLCGLTSFVPKHSEYIQDGIKYDCEEIPLQGFLKIASQGQTIAYDMLFSPREKWILEENFEYWENVIVPARNRFVSRRCANFIGYAIGQAAKYNAKAGKIKIYKTAIDKLSLIEDRTQPIENFIELLLDGDNIRTDQNGRVLICDVSVALTTPVEELLDLCERRLNKYGERAHKAVDCGGLDYKALSHALRAVYEVEELVETGSITFPLKHADEVKALKEGRLSVEDPTGYILERAKDMERKIEKSNLPKNGGEYSDLILAAYKHYYGLSL